MLLYSDDYLSIEAEDYNVFLIVEHPGIDIRAFGQICDQVPRLKLTKFGAAKSALDLISGQRTLIGQLKPIVDLEVSSDGMAAHIVINLLDVDYKTNSQMVYNKILLALKDNDIKVGVLGDVINSPLEVGKKILIAEGVPPQHGLDAKITYYAFGDKKPMMKNDGKVNHYELQLIDNVEKGEWLGEKIPATLGQEGMSVTGDPVSAKAGRDYKLKYDSKTVSHHQDDQGGEVLKAKIHGAVKMKAGKICVDNHLVIEGDVDYNTGNIDFDGYVTVTGTVKDKFEIRATNDISINGLMGIGATGLIESLKGSVLLKGGVNGKGEARILAHRDIYTKYANEADLEAGGNIHVGLYAMDSHMVAQKIILPPKEGRIIGGLAKAEHRIETGSIGNKYEKPTQISVEGFERDSVLEMLRFYKEKQEGDLKVAHKIKRELEVFENNLKKLDDRGMTTYEYMLIKYDKLQMEIQDLDAEIRKFEDILRTRGEGEVAIGNSVYPKTTLEIKEMFKRIKDEMTGSFYVQDKTLHHNT